MSSRRTRVLATVLAALTVGGVTSLPTTPAEAATSPTTSTTSGWKPRPAQYASTVTSKDLAIRMSDGTVLRGDLTRPSKDGKTPIAGRWPVVVTITAYNKSSSSTGTGLAGAPPAYLVQRGYAQLTVDARGTGSSEGSWAAFSAREDKDATEVMTWAAKQPFSNGRTAMSGPSYMGISQIFAAAGRPPGLKAIFPQVPAGDVYRDVVASGGQLDVGFMPLWLGLVTATGVIPPAVTATDPQSGVSALLAHIAAGATFSGMTLLQASLGQEQAYDGPFYAERSPINVISRVNVPTFLVSGEFDLFQRGTPLLFENLRRRGVPVKMITGPWDHLQASAGSGIDKAGHGTLAQLQLRWFDHYVKGRPDATLDSDIPPMTWFEQGSGAWRKGTQWVGSDRRASTWSLSGSATTMTTPGLLTRGTPKAGTADVLPIPVAGLCTRSASQWTAGGPNALPFPNPCLQDNAPNDNAGVVFQSNPVTTAQAFQGPINAHLFVSSTSGDGMLSVAVEDVAPDGTVSRLTGGWQVISHRALNTSRSRYLDGRLIQPYHPFTQAAQKPLASGQVAPVDVEVFPTGARILPGHRLRVSIQAFDVPHLAPTLPLLPGSLGVLTLHTGPAYPSSITVPGLR